MSHDDVIPYTNTSADPFIHELFGQFLVPSESKEGKTDSIGSIFPCHAVSVSECNYCFTGLSYVPRDVLSHWREKNHEWLELSEVHCETTQNVRVTVMPFYMGWIKTENKKDRTHWWR